MRNREEWRFVALVSVLLLVVATLPYGFAFLSAPPDKIFMGFVLGVADHAQYLAWYRDFQHASLIPNSLTSEPNSPLFFNLLWWTLGRFGYYTGLHYALVYQLFRWVAGGFFLAMSYLFTSLLFDDLRRRRFAFLVIALGSGLGWVLVVLKYSLTPGRLLYPLDLYIAEGNSFLCLMAYPHFAEAAGLILAIFWLLVVGERDGRRPLRHAVAAGVVAQLLGWQHGYDLIIVWGIPAAYISLRVLRERRVPLYWLKALAIVWALSWPPALYAVLLTRTDALWAQTLRQYTNAGVFSPTPLHMLIYMGVPLLTAMLTLIYDARGQWQHSRPTSACPDAELFVVTWFVAGWALAYLPTVFQVHLLNSLQVPVALLATVGYFRFVVDRHWRHRSAGTYLTLAFLVLIVPTNVYLLAWRFYDLARRDYPYYLYRDDVAALQWIEARDGVTPVVLSAYDVGRFVPLLAGGRGFLAHWAMTLDFYAKRELVAEFFAGTTTERRRQEILERYDIDYVIHGPAEATLGSYDPEHSSFLVRVFSTARTQVYAFRRDAPRRIAGWSTPTMISPDGDSVAAPPAWFPDVAVDHSNRAHVFWVSWRKDDTNPHGGYDSVVHCVVAAEYCTTSEVLTFDWWGGINATRPAAAVDADDHIHVLARGMTGLGGRTHLYHSQADAAHADQATAWSTPQRISGPGSASYSTIVFDPHGSIHIAWSEQVPVPSERRSPQCPAFAHVLYRRSTDRGQTWSDPADLTPASTVAEKPQLVVSGDDAVHLVWEEGPGNYSCGTLDPVGVGIVSSFDHGSMWSSPTMLTAANDAPQRPAVAYDGRNLLVVWGLIKSTEVFYQASADRGRSWSPPQPLPGLRSRWLENDLDAYHMAADDNGHVHAVVVGRQLQDRPEMSSVLHLEWNGREWMEPQPIFTSDVDVPEWPRIAVAGDGTLHVVWYVRDQAHVWQSNGGHYRVWHAQR